MRPLQFVPVAPTDFIGGASSTMQLILHSAQANGFARAIMYGSAGIGKSAVAMACASLLAKSSFAIESLNGQSLSPQKLRDWSMNAPYKSLFGDWTVKVVDEIDSMSQDAENELLTFLDRLPQFKRWAFICTTNQDLAEKSKPDEKGKIPWRVHSRMQVHKFYEVTPVQVADFIYTKWPVIPHDRALTIARANEGNVRGALNDADMELTRMAVAC